MGEGPLLLFAMWPNTVGYKQACFHASTFHRGPTFTQEILLHKVNIEHSCTSGVKKCYFVTVLLLKNIWQLLISIMGNFFFNIIMLYMWVLVGGHISWLQSGKPVILFHKYYKQLRIYIVTRLINNRKYFHHCHHYHHHHGLENKMCSMKVH